MIAWTQSYIDARLARPDTDKARAFLEYIAELIANHNGVFDTENHFIDRDQTATDLATSIVLSIFELRDEILSWPPINGTFDELTRKQRAQTAMMQFAAGMSSAEEAREVIDIVRNITDPRNEELMECICWNVLSPIHLAVRQLHE